MYLMHKSLKSYYNKMIIKVFNIQRSRQSPWRKCMVMSSLLMRSQRGMSIRPRPKLQPVEAIGLYNDLQVFTSFYLTCRVSCVSFKYYLTHFSSVRWAEVWMTRAVPMIIKLYIINITKKGRRNKVGHSIFHYIMGT